MPYLYFEIFDYILLTRSFLTCKISKSLKKITRKTLVILDKEALIQSNFWRKRGGRTPELIKEKYAYQNFNECIKYI